MRGRVVHRLTNRAHRHGRIRVRVKIPSDYPLMGGLNWNITSSLIYSRTPISRLVGVARANSAYHTHTPTWPRSTCASKYLPSIQKSC